MTSPAVANGWERGMDVGTCLDYCFVTVELSRHVRSVRIDNDAEASDHQPVWIDFDFDDSKE